MRRLEGKVAIITGGARGLGEAHARLFVAEGAKVILTDVLEDAGRQVAADLGGNAMFLKHDVTDPEAWRTVVDEAVSAFGPVTILVNNAGVSGAFALAAELSDEAYSSIMKINADGVFYGMRAVIPGMIEAGGGSIVNISSVAGFVHGANSTNAAYTASKFAVRGLTKAAAVEYGPRNIRVNSVHPGGIATQMSISVTTQEQRDAFASMLPLRRLGEPHEIAKLVLFLASDESSYMTASACVIDGGMLH